MKTFTANEAAAEIGVSPRALRRHLRLSPSWRSAGLGGRYAFTETDVRALKREMAGTPAPRTYARKDEGTKRVNRTLDCIEGGTTLGDLEDMTVLKNKKRKADVKARYEARQAKLVQRIDELGLTNVDA